MSEYRYTACGLDNVTIEGMTPCIDDEGDEVCIISNLAGLHRAIADAIIAHDTAMSGKELRFLRTEIGMTQAELAQLVHRDGQSIGRWERGEVDIEPTAEALIRALAIGRLNLTDDESGIDEISRRCTPSALPQPIVIDGHDPSQYRQLKRAA